MSVRINQLLLMLFLVLLVSGGGCRLRLPGPQADPQVPPLPEALAQENGREPALRIYLHETGEVQEMGFEEYIAGVVAAEMDPQWHEEALAAQAIIARSFTLQKINEDGGVPERGAHASTNIEEFQAYSAERINERVRRAVEKSRGQVAVYRGGYIRGWFHAFAGPRTALADEGLEFEGGNPPYIQIVDSPGGNIVPAEEGTWTASFPLSEVRSAAAGITGTDPGPVESAAISAKGPSGRATGIRLNDVEVSAPALRLALDSTVMRSTFIEALDLQDGSLNLSGSGYGHGVGMCQWGARALAEEGRSCEEIVDYFYRDVDVVQVWQ